MQRQLHRLTRDRRAQVDFGDGHCLDIDGDGQVRQCRKRERRCFCVWQGLLFTCGQARQVDPRRTQLRHFKASAQQGRAVPVQHDIFYRQPDTIGVGDCHPVKRRLRAQRALKARNLDLASGPAQQILDLAYEEALVLLLGSGRQGQQERREGKDKAENTHQKDCPMPM